MQGVSWLGELSNHETGHGEPGDELAAGDILTRIIRRGRAGAWWAYASHARGDLHVARWKQARPSDRRPTRVLACLSPPYIVVNNPG